MLWTEAASVVVKAGIIVILGYIAMSDFQTQKIRNQHLAYLLMAALALIAVRLWAGQSAWSVVVEAAASGLLFVALFVFWMLGKVGAGDVKLLAIIPLIVGIEGSMTFSIGMLALTVVIFILTRFPVLVPARWFKTYLVGLGKTGRIPFGVPISAAAILALLAPLPLVTFPSDAAQPLLTTTDFSALNR